LLNGGKATFFKADISKLEEVKAFIDFIHQKFYRIDFAVLNAGIAGKGGRIDTYDDNWFFTENDAIFNNLYGGMFLLKEITKYWMEHGNKLATYSIVMITSYNGLRACPTCDSYSASKHGIIGLV
jgi:NAD(P)-dependent dehydrogenase (short-subunit alcohol dehydrogenase family)